MTRLSQWLYAVLVALTVSAPALAAESGRVPLPQIPAARGDHCVEPTDVMRRKHYEFLLSHRDKTMHQGIRTKKYSLKACLECHAPAQEQTVSAHPGKEQGGHFCQNCHMYAGVKIDCFECHATRPERDATFHPLVTPGMEQVKEAHEGSAAMLNQMATEKTGAAQ